MRDHPRLFTAVLGLILAACSLVAWLASNGSAGEAPSGSSAAKAAPSDPVAKQIPAKTSPEPAAAKPEPADNSYCLVCHANYENEKLTKHHQPVGVGCEKCHGESVKHSGDEDGITPPEKMYAKPDIDPFCITCHEKPKLLKRDEHKIYFKEREDGDTCSDCHAEKHQLKVRTRVWDKKTGKLLKDDGVRMMQKDSPATEGAAAKSK